ncbi:hypothetical protein CHEID_01015 [Corynebacterium heidelbergense]|nr:hypothetical protein CHEID_01015 [Corynebacterium heidelbergense]
MELAIQAAVTRREGPVTSFTVPEVLQARPEVARGAAACMAECGQQVQQQARDTHDTRLDGWEGDAAAAAQHRVDALTNRLGNLGAAAECCGHAGAAFATTLQIARTTISAAVAAARAVGIEVAANGSLCGSLARFLPLVRKSIEGPIRAALTLLAQVDAASAAVVHTVGDVEAPAAGTAQPWTPPSFGPQTRIEQTPDGPVVYSGDLERADQIITIVNGVHSSEPGAAERTAAWAQRLVDHAAANGQTIAVAGWHAYSAPGNLATAALPIAAEEAAPRLREFQNHLRAVNPTAQLHVTGYSYGSVVVGTAAQSPGAPLGADRVTFLGSPGVRAGHRNQLHTQATDGRTEVRSIHVPGDLIGLTTWPDDGAHGRDPSAPTFGAEDTAPRGASWGSYLWHRLRDTHIVAEGDRDTHSSYPYDPEVEEALLQPGR